MSTLVPIFIISSSESLTYANQLRDRVNNQITMYDTREARFHCETWEDYFKDAAKGINQSFWDLLYNKAQNLRAQRGYAVALWTFDDQAIIRSAYYKIPRGNVILEYGLFYGALGPSHMFYFSEVNKHQYTPKYIPSDLAGIRYDEIGVDIDINKAATAIIERLLKDPRTKEPTPDQSKDSRPPDPKNTFIEDNILFYNI